MAKIFITSCIYYLMYHSSVCVCVCMCVCVCLVIPVNKPLSYNEAILIGRVCVSLYDFMTCHASVVVCDIRSIKEFALMMPLGAGTGGLINWRAQCSIPLYFANSKRCISRSVFKVDKQYLDC